MSNDTTHTAGVNDDPVADPAQETDENGGATPPHFGSAGEFPIGQRPDDDDVLEEAPPRRKLRQRKQKVPRQRTKRSFSRESIIAISAVSAWVILAFVTIFTPMPWSVLLALTILALFLWKIVAAVNRQIRIEQKKKSFHEQATSRRRIVAVFNTNGGSGKSTLISTLATLWSIVSRKDTGLADFNNNSGHVLERVGIKEGTTLRVSQVLRSLGIPGLLRRMIHELPTSEYGLTGIDREIEVIGNDQLSFRDVCRVIAELIEEFHSLFIDNGNNAIGDFELAAANETSVAIFVANTGKPESLIDVAKTMNNISANGVTNLVERSLAVLCRPYPWYLWWLNQHNELPDLDPRVKVMYLPWDRHLKFVRFGRPLRYGRLRAKTREALLDIGLEVCKIAPRVAKTRLTPDEEAQLWIDEQIEALQSKPEPGASFAPPDPTKMGQPAPPPPPAV